MAKLTDPAEVLAELRQIYDEAASEHATGAKMHLMQRMYHHADTLLAALEDASKLRSLYFEHGRYESGHGVALRREDTDETLLVDASCVDSVHAARVAERLARELGLSAIKIDPESEAAALAATTAGEVEGGE